MVSVLSDATDYVSVSLKAVFFMPRASLRPSRRSPPSASTSNHPRLIAITGPLLAELVLGIFVGLVGLWLASKVSDTASAAFGLANQVQATFFLLFRIIGMGASVVITQNLGAGNRQAADDMARAALGASTWIGIGAGGMLLGLAGVLLRLLNAPDDVLLIADPYLRMLALVLLLDAFNACMGSVMRAHMFTADTLFTMILMHVFHLMLSVPLMGGWGPFPPMGIIGFAVAAALSRLFGIALHLTLWRWRLHLVPRLKDWWQLRHDLLAAALHIGLPGAAENIAYRLALLATVSMTASMGANALAAHSYTTQISFFILVFSLAVGFSCEIMVGHLIGARELGRAHKLVSKSLRLAIFVSTSVALLVAISSPWLMHFFTHDPAIISTCTTLLWITVLLEPGRAFNLVVINALRATGDARFPVAAGIVSMVVVMTGGSWLFGVYFHLGLPGIWIAYALDEWTRGLIMCARWWRQGWVPAVRQTNRRLRAQ